jgi:uncharacterized protein (DUF924 family)
MTGACDVTPAEILTFWRAAGRERWSTRDGAFDAEVRSRFFELWQKASAGELSSWEATDDGALALVIVLDQFPRNMFRDDIRAYSSDGLARAVADRAIARGADMGVEAALLEFLYMPLMHSEQLADQQRCVELFRKAGNSAIRRASSRDHPPVRAFPASQSYSGAPDDAGGTGLSRSRRIFGLMTDR